MRAKEHLRQINAMNKRIDNLRKEADMLRDYASSPRPTEYEKDMVQGSSIKDRTARAITKYMDVEQEIDVRTDKMVRSRHEIIREINQLKEPNHIELLMMRYVEGRTFEQIAREMGYSVRQVLRIHGSALQEFDRKILHNTKMS